MIKIEKAYYPVCIRVIKGKVSECKTYALDKNLSIGKTYYVVGTEIEQENAVLLSFLFDEEVGANMFLSRSGTYDNQVKFPISLKITGDNREELLNVLSEIGKLPKIMACGELYEQGIAVLIVCESKADADRITSMASEETQ